MIRTIIVIIMIIKIIIIIIMIIIIIIICFTLLWLRENSCGKYFSNNAGFGVMVRKHG